jgi:hypothetical protein
MTGFGKGLETTGATSGITGGMTVGFTGETTRDGTLFAARGTGFGIFTLGFRTACFDARGLTDSVFLSTGTTFLGNSMMISLTLGGATLASSK